MWWLIVVLVVVLVLVVASRGYVFCGFSSMSLLLMWFSNKWEFLIDLMVIFINGVGTL